MKTKKTLPEARKNTTSASCIFRCIFSCIFRCIFSCTSVVTNTHTDTQRHTLSNTQRETVREGCSMCQRSYAGGIQKGGFFARVFRACFAHNFREVSAW